MSTLLNALTADQEQMKAWRHHMHQHPEVAFEEHNTARYIADLLRGWGYEVTENIGKTGLVARMSCGDGKKSIGLRADTDALAVQEMIEGGHKSTIPGKSHTCGHDGHSAMLLGAAHYLAHTRAFNGTVNLIFQPAEEIMGGAVAMIKDGLFERFPMDAVFGMHNMPTLERGKLYFTAGPVMAAVGTTGRSSSPARGVTGRCRRRVSTRWWRGPPWSWRCRRSCRATLAPRTLRW
ncbi:amidohydrolase [Thauera humireducens]|uniref:amidohydrolase n=1 Tax=Thauera humireducens TaxID=1134435 RepID=UPI00311D5A99